MQHTTTLHVRADRLFLGSTQAAYALAREHGVPIQQARQDGSVSIRWYSPTGRRRSRHVPASRVKIEQTGGRFFL